MLLLLHCLELDALALVLQSLDPQDLQSLDLADGGALFRERGPALTKEVRFVYVAARILTDAEQTWFAERGLSVRLLVEHMTDTNDAQVWLRNGQLHRDSDQPAIIGTDGTQEWYQNGQRHRDNDQPAVIWPDGTQLWYQNGQLHRDNDQPAIIGADGTQSWYQNGRLHRRRRPFCAKPAGMA